MEDNKEVNQENVEAGKEEGNKEDRPEVNYQAELARKNAEIQRLRAERETLSAQPVKRDQSDLTTWTDGELKMLRNSNDASVAQYKDQADEILLERKVRAIQARDYETRKREETRKTLETEYPETADPHSEFSVKMEKVMQEYDLHKTPAGRLAAAKIVSAEGKNAQSKGQTKESKRVTSVKGQMVDGDRPKPTEVKDPNDTKALKDKLLKEKDTSHAAVGEWLDQSNLRERFGKVWGK